MKKSLFALALCLLLTACSQPAGVDPADTSSPAATTPSVPETLAPLPSEGDEVEIVTVETALGENAVRVLRYPRLPGEGTDAVNAALAAIAERTYTEHATNVQTMIGEGSAFSYTVTSAEILRRDAGLLSVLCRAEIKLDGRVTQSIVYACNLDPATGTEYTADALVCDFGGLTALLREGKGSIVWGKTDLLSQTSWDELLVQIKPNYGIYPAVCFDAEGVIVNFEVVELLDWNVGCRISYADAAGCLTVAAPQ